MSGRKRFILSSCLVVIMSAGNAYAAAPDRAAVSGLLPHKALYNIRLATKRSGTQVSGISGQMVFEWQPDCEAWISNTQFNLTYEYMEAPSMHVTSDFSTYERIDGERMNFTSQRKREGTIFEEFRGLAAMNPEAGSPRAIYSLPEDLEKELPENTLFPVAHTLGVLDAIHAGKKFYTATIFDGSDEEGASLVNTFIGKPVDVSQYIRKDVPKYDNDLLGKKAWNLRLAFFPLDKPDETLADYEMNAVFHDTGVISHMIVEYSDFSIEQSLVAVEPMPSVCGQKHKNTEKGKDKTDNPE